MTTESMLDRRLRELMAELAAPGDQSAAIDNVISVTRTLRPEPRWRALLKERPMRTNSIVIAGSPPMRFGLIFAVIALIALLAATVVVGALVLRQPALPPAYGPADNGMLAYAAAGDIVTTAADGSNVTAITTGPASIVARCSRATAPGLRSCARSLLRRGCRGQRRRDGTGCGFAGTVRRRPRDRLVPGRRSSDRPRRPPPQTRSADVHPGTGRRRHGIHRADRTR